MKKLRYDEAYVYAGGCTENRTTWHDFAGFVVGVDWCRTELWPIDELWSEFLAIMTP